MTVDEMLAEAIKLEKKYVEHFKTEIPDGIFWWDPLNISLYPDEMQAGLKKMRLDINNAIESDTPFPENDSPFTVIY